MKISIFAYSKKGCDTAEKVAEALREISSEGCEGCGLGCENNNEWNIALFTAEKHLREGFGLISKEAVPNDIDAGVKKINYGKAFGESDAFISIGSCGIAVRHIAPFIRSKTTDPAVIVIDELGHFAISLLSGHVGGANKLTAEISQKIGAVPVITTATDINGRFSADTWAAESGYVIGSMKLAKDVSAEILERDVPICIEETLMPKEDSALPNGLVLSKCDCEAVGSENAKPGTIGIFVGYSVREPFERTLRLIPKVLSIGLGCRKDTPKERVAAAVSRVFDENGLDIRAICSVSSIDIKKDEKGILEFCEDIKIKPDFFTAEELGEAKGEFSTSDFVKGVTGVDNVCERAAVLCGGRLIVKKTACDGVTVAVALIEKEVRF